MIEITQDSFERFVPAFRDSESRTFEAVLPYIERYRDKAYGTIGVPADFGEDGLVEAYAYRNAAFAALPHLDLILTDNGFAVVSNSNLAPASRERVAALRERLRLERSDARDLLLLALCKLPSWRGTDGCRLLRSTLLWCPMLLRRHGVATLEGSHVGLEEYSSLLPAINHAWRRVVDIVSLELAEWLRLHQDETDGDPEYAGDMRIVLREQCRNLMAAHISERTVAVRALTVQIQDFLNRNAELLPEYYSSSKYRADNFTPYQNGKNDSTFFFG